MSLRVLASLLFWPLVPAMSGAGAASERYVPYRFEASENWRMTSGGDAGESRFDRGRWVLDFSRGAQWIAIAPPDRVLLGTPKTLTLTVRGAAGDHPVRLSLYTHFMTFHGPAAGLAGSGERRIVFEAPPGPGWTWEEGENDGKIHGPLRVAEIRIERGSTGGRTEIELLGLEVESQTPEDRRCVLTVRNSGPEADARFYPEARCLTGVSMDGTLSWKFRDWDQNPLGEGSRPVRIEPAAAPLHLVVQGPSVQPGRRYVQGDFTLDIAGQQVPQVQSCWLARIPPNNDTALRPESPFGMGVYLGRYEGSDMDATAAVARAAGVKWSREDFEWQRIEPERGRFDWKFHDRLVAAAKRNGISVYAIVAGWPSWTKPYTEEGITDWLVFLKELVRHYRADIHQWEIWNEPNIFFWQGPRDLYASFLTRSYAVVKDADPRAEVLGLSTAGIDYAYIARMLAFEAPFDVLTIHPYRKTLDDRFFINELKVVSDLIRLPDGRRRPVWLTEMGWSTYTPHNTLRQDFEPTLLRSNAQFLARSYLCSIVSGVDPRTFWYNFRNDGEDPLYFENEMGILYRDFRPKPSYAAYSTLAGVLAGRKVAGPVDAGAGIFAYRFDGRGTAYVLWSPRSDATAVLAVNGSAAVTNTIGESQAATARNGRLSVDLKAGSPVYVEIR